MNNDIDELITANIPLVGHIVRETMSRVPMHVDRDDLTSAGLTALVRAGQCFEEDRGVPFVRYAATRIRGAVLDELRGLDWASRSVRRMARDVDATRVQLSGVLGEPPTDAQVAVALGVPESEVSTNAAEVARAQVLSLQGAGERGLDDRLVSTAPSPEREVEQREQLTYLVEAVTELPERLRTVVQDYFLKERPMAEIAAELGVSESRVSQMRAEGLVLLRGALTRALDPEVEPAEHRPAGCVSRRREAYYAAVATRHAAGLRGALSAPVVQESA